MSMTISSPVGHTRVDRTPLSFAQQRLWFLDQLEPDGDEYLIRRALRLSGPVDVTALRVALSGVVARHDALRTRFAAGEDGRPYTVVGPPAPVPVRVVEVPAADVDTVVNATAVAPFDLAAGPLLRAVLVRSGPEDAVLVVCLHHIVFDGLSEPVLARELGVLYAAATGDPSAVLPEVPVRYADYAVWQHRRLTDERQRMLLDYWRDKLSGLRPLQLPTDRPRRAVRGTAGDVVGFTIPAETLRPLARTAGRAGATLFMALLGGFQVMLSRYSGQDDVAVGTAVAGRTLSGTENLIGLFVNSLVLRTDLSGDPTFAELLGRVRDTAVGAFGHLDLPFERLVEELAVGRDLSRNPLFDAMLVLQKNPPGSAWRLAGVEVEQYPLAAPDSETDLTLHLTQQDDGSAVGRLYFSTDLFDRSTVERMGEHLLVLLDELARQADVPISAVSMIPAVERARVLVEWNDTAGPFPAGRLLHELVAERAATHPDEPAVVGGGMVLTHGELDERARRLAHRLRDLGVRPGVLVGVFLERCPELVVALLAILRAGGAYVPLDPEHPADRIGFVLDDTAARLVITQEDLADRLPATTDRLLVDADWPTVATYPATEPAPIATPSDLAYVIYTSGSTGRPKGVMVEHEGIVNYLAGMQHDFPLRPGDAFLQATPLTFDVSAYEIFWPLWQGGTVVLVPGATRLDMAHVSSLMREHRVVGLHFVPSLMDVFANEADPADCAALRYAFCSGEALPRTLVRRFAERFTGDLVNLYGATEVSVDTTYWRAEPDTPVLAGRPMLNQTVYVLDAARRPVPVGVVGEVYLGGLCVGRGYWNRPELTEERFVLDPFQPGGRLYRTGDLGRFTSDGQLDFLGRADTQVKLRGVRIELGEIEAALLSDPDVGACVVVLRQDQGGDKHLVAYCVGDGELDTVAVRERCAGLLPSVMVPAVFVALPELPLTSNGKVDRGRLPEPDLARVVTGAVHVPPGDEVEEAIAGVWADVLGVRDPGVHDDFFASGGHSLRAVQLVNQVERLTGVRISLRALFLTPTIAGVKSQLLAMIEDQS
ncbi:non-ribosomal peptide synthetase [Actinophytocola oryzae]|uniref:Amino acid adenylation domain-containing protein n=1 Tax=Actinophytocola oryzae TaxID=502181 RepID=A0A4R7VL01_9PSEU|nr:non-ribosomal peptide synthetase [Actinophytocola oryzae]TDV49927.1 amino acid adenylation domain-containing protein [Actinophytocola oryzae]